MLDELVRLPIKRAFFRLPAHQDNCTDSTSRMLGFTVARKCETRWDEMERDHVLDRDYFAYLCGQGKRLRTALRHQLNDRIQQNQPDNAIPTLVERIDHLDSLIGREAR